MARLPNMHLGTSPRNVTFPQKFLKFTPQKQTCLDMLLSTPQPNPPPAPQLSCTQDQILSGETCFYPQVESKMEVKASPSPGHPSHPAGSFCLQDRNCKEFYFISSCHRLTSIHIPGAGAPGAGFNLVSPTHTYYKTMLEEKHLLDPSRHLQRTYSPVRH